MRNTRLDGASTESKWEQLAEKMKGSMTIKKIRPRQRKIGHLEWWEMQQSKEEGKESIQKMEKGQGNQRGVYRRKKKIQGAM